MRELGAALEHGLQQPVGHELGPLIPLLSHKQSPHHCHAVLPIGGEHMLQRQMIAHPRGLFVQARGPENALQQPLLHEMGLRCAS